MSQDSTTLRELFQEIADVQGKLTNTSTIENHMKRAGALAAIHSQVADILFRTDEEGLTNSGELWVRNKWIGNSAKISGQRCCVTLTHPEKPNMQPVEEAEIRESLQGTLEIIKAALPSLDAA
jgi:hypothetical protein